MSENKLYPPEGLTPRIPYSLSDLREAMETRAILESTVQKCDTAQNLHVPLGGLTAIVPRSEVTAPWISGAERDIAILSRVGKPICFTVESICADAKGAPQITISRRKAQESAMAAFQKTLRPGAVVTGRVVGLASFGAFVDIGCGIVALLPTEYISAAHIRHPDQRFRLGQKISAVVKVFDKDARRITLTHKELLGTWLENAGRFDVGDTVHGIVRGVKDYGCFVELTPNLSGLTDRREDLREGDGVSVTLRSIHPENMKIKLQVIERLPDVPKPAPLSYHITDGVLDRWVYSPVNYAGTPVETVFTRCP